MSPEEFAKKISSELIDNDLCLCERSSCTGLEELTELVRQYTHELAEKVRAQDPVEAALAGQDAWRMAADLIDPEGKL